MKLAGICSIADELGIRRVILVDASKRLTRWGRQRLALPACPQPNTLEVLQYTGGTTGRAEGANLDQLRRLDQRRATRGIAAVGADEHILIVTPRTTPTPSRWGFCSPPIATARCDPGALSPGRCARTIAAHGITLFAGSPTLFVGMMAHEAFATTDFHLRLCFSGASALPVETMRRWEQRPAAASARATAKARPARC